jgi:hypothetical protein
VQRSARSRWHFCFVWDRFRIGSSSRPDWITAVLTLAGIETDAQYDREGSTFTRRSLINTLTRFRRQVALDHTAHASKEVELHLLDIETARLRHERLADRWWGPARASLEALDEVRREAVRRVVRCRGDGAALLLLLDDAIGALMVAPERTSEVMARRGRLDPNTHLGTRNVEAFWTKQLGRRRDDLKGMIALADVVWRLIGQRKSPPALREAFARHLERHE